MTDHNAVADVLDDAADYIEKNGWVQCKPGRYVETGGDCASNALVEVGEWGETLQVAHAALASSAEIPGWSTLDQAWNAVQEWNDEPERTKQEVLDAFRLAAKSERRLSDEAVR